MCDVWPVTPAASRGSPRVGTFIPSEGSSDPSKGSPRVESRDHETNGQREDKSRSQEYRVPMLSVHYTLRELLAPVALTTSLAYLHVCT
jgi:hypothetical protein